MKDIQQLIKKNSLEGRYEDIFPKTFIDAVLDKESGVTLTDILAMFNMLFLSYNGSRSQTRLQVPSSLRREGLWVTYVLYDKTVVTEWYSAEAIDDTTFGDSANWRDGSNALVGDISISSDGYWVINGEVTNIKAQGEAGITPILRVGSNNHLQVSYTNGSTYVDVSPNPVFTQFRVSNNKLQQSTDLGESWSNISEELAYKFRESGNKIQMSKDLGNTWEDVSDYIAAWFRFTGTTGSSQADNVGKIQISRDNGATWSDLSGEFTNSLHIKGYVATVGALPSTAVQGDIYGVGPTYDPSDTEHTNPIYQLYVKDSTGWVNNGRFTSIAAGVVQELGDSETATVSQKIISENIRSTRVVSSLVSVDNYLDRFINVDLQKGIIQFPEGTVIYCKGEQFKLINKVEVSIICTKFDGTPEASSYSYLLFNKINSSITNITSTYITIDRLDDYVILGALKKSSPTTTVSQVSDLVIYSSFDYMMGGKLYRTSDFSFLETRAFPLSYPLFIKGVWFNGNTIDRSRSYSSSLPIKINHNEDIYVRGYNKVGGVGLVLNFYDINLKFISGIGENLKSGLTSIKVDSSDIPTNAEYFIVNGTSSIIDDYYIIHSTIQDLKDNFIPIKDYDYYGYINKVTGVYTYNEDYKLTGFIKLTKGGNYLTSAREGSSGAAISFYDANYNFIGALSKDTIVDGTQQLITFTSDEAPAGTVYFRSNSETASKGYVCGASVLDISSEKVDSVIELNKDLFSNIDILKYSYDENEADYSNIQKSDNLLFLYASDLHKDYLGDSVEECPSLNRIVEVYDYLKPDFMIITGDVVADNYSNDYSFVKRAVEDRIYLPTIGNHEIIGASSQSDLYNKYIAPFEVSSALTVHTIGGNKKPYYSKVVKGIRIICVNNYDYGDAQMGYGECYSQEQIDWFINELELANSNNQSVIVAMHYTPDSNFDTDSNFRQKFTIYHNEPRLTTSSRSIILYIIEAFMKASLIDGIWQQQGFNSVTVSHTFKKRGKFVCYLTGHRHGDYTSYSKYDTNQLILNTASTYYGNNSYNLCDLTRSSNGKNRDLFNIVSVNIRNSELNIARVGAQYSSKLEKRDFIKFNLS